VRAHEEVTVLHDFRKQLDCEFVQIFGEHIESSAKYKGLNDKVGGFKRNFETCAKPNQYSCVIVALYEFLAQFEPAGVVITRDDCVFRIQLMSEQCVFFEHLSVEQGNGWP
jgi:hypothetical protein